MCQLPKKEGGREEHELGTVRSAGSVGAGDLTMAVTGTKASGVFEAILERKGGKWTLITGQLTLSDGRVIYLEAPSLETSGAVNHGRQLSTASVDTQYWQQLTWPQQNISLRVPESWIQKEANQRQWDIRAGERYSSTYLMANAWIWERNLPAQNLVAADAQTASEKLRNGIIEENNIFSGSKRKFQDMVFRGGEINCIFGGSELDLTHAKLEEGVNQLEVNCIFGGITLIVPSDWNVQLKKDSIFGDFADKRPYSEAQKDNTRILIVKASCIFGGGEIKSYV